MTGCSKLRHSSAPCLEVDRDQLPRRHRRAAVLLRHKFSLTFMTTCMRISLFSLFSLYSATQWCAARLPCLPYMACCLLFVLMWLCSVVRLLALLDLHVQSIVFFALQAKATKWCAAHLLCLTCMHGLSFSLFHRLRLRSGVLPIVPAWPACCFMLLFV